MSSLAHHLEEPTSGLVVFMMAAQMPTEPRYPLGEQCYLYLSRAGILIVSAVFLNNGLFLARIQHASGFSSLLLFPLFRALYHTRETARNEVGGAALHPLNISGQLEFHPATPYDDRQEESIRLCTR